MKWLLYGLISVAAYAQDPGCTTGQAWAKQTNPSSDVTGQNNNFYPELLATYWATSISAPRKAQVKGTFPAARALSFGAYNSGGGLVAYLDDAAIVPDPGTNNPFVTGTSLGTYTVQVVWEETPANPAPNTLYVGMEPGGISLIYRVHYANDPDDLTGGVGIPTLKVGNSTVVNCPPRPIAPPDSTPWGRFADQDFSGPKPERSQHATNPPSWQLIFIN